ncbi:hypothetical protein [Desulfopila sp. IMCC35008]|uniref:hypothetical protein n=1 Tax=Desulfopila sp. IMCC35008 TaxID=2653858 RepID=UPI0013D08996|nr:hypothetical protein [Desulfopila sp. IMCC35008]
MRGQIISSEFNKMVWVKDEKGAQYACYAENHEDVSRKEDLSDEEQNKCMNLNAVIGDSW